MGFTYEKTYTKLVCEQMKNVMTCVSIYTELIVESVAAAREPSGFVWEMETGRIIDESFIDIYMHIKTRSNDRNYHLTNNKLI